MITLANNLLPPCLTHTHAPDTPRTPNNQTNTNHAPITFSHYSHVTSTKIYSSSGKIPTLYYHAIKQRQRLACLNNQPLHHTNPQLPSWKQGRPNYNHTSLVDDFNIHASHLINHQCFTITKLPQNILPFQSPYSFPHNSSSKDPPHSQQIQLLV